MDMMGKIKFLLVGYMLCSLLEANAATVSYHISNYDKGKKLSFFLTTTEEEHPVCADEAGKGEFEIKDKHPQYVYMQYGERKQLLFVEPEGKLTVYWNDEEFPGTRFDGDGAAASRYLNSHQMVLTTNRDNKLRETVFLEKLDSIYAVHLQALEESELPDSFRRIERVRLKCIVYDKMFMYPQFHKHLAKDAAYSPTKDFYEKIEMLADFSDEWLFLSEYRNFLINAASSLSTRKNISHKGSLRSALYADQYVASEQIRELLINYYATSYVRNFGLKGADELVRLFKKHVNRPDLVSKFQTLCGTWERIADGYYAPSFSAVDVNGKEVILEQFRGKPVYIDVWATWCVPCRKEIPCLKDLEKEYGSQVHFVSISIDKNQETWKKMVQKEELNGIQLHYDGNETFLDDYMIKGIPRFVLLDREGRIVSANASRPSDRRTRELLEGLLE